MWDSNSIYFITILLIPEKQDRLILALKVFHGLDLHLTPNSEVMNENTQQWLLLYFEKPSKQIHSPVQLKMEAYALGVQNIICHPWRKQRNKRYLFAQ